MVMRGPRSATLMSEPAPQSSDVDDAALLGLFTERLLAAWSAATFFRLGRGTGLAAAAAAASRSSGVARLCSTLATMPARVVTPILIMIRRRKALTVFGLIFIRSATSLLP